MNKKRSYFALALILIGFLFLVGVIILLTKTKKHTD